MEEANRQFDEWFDEITPTVKIGYLEYNASRALRLLDPIAYRTSVYEWECENEEE
tara:strand:+ start:1068 stop:1232 length:165 start_codon:yes stop_codon:yes gene_type:complete